jgi:hypothetical protein
MKLAKRPLLEGAKHSEVLLLEYNLINYKKTKGILPPGNRILR